LGGFLGLMGYKKSDKMDMELEKIFADFNNADVHGRIRLSTKGSLEDIQLKKIELKDGKQIFLDDENEMTTLGVLRFSIEEDIWVAEINWNNFTYKK
jgi:hypothetical protein